MIYSISESTTDFLNFLEPYPEHPFQVEIQRLETSEATKTSTISLRSQQQKRIYDQSIGKWSIQTKTQNPVQVKKPQFLREVNILNQNQLQRQPDQLNDVGSKTKLIDQNVSSSVPTSTTHRTTITFSRRSLTPKSQQRDNSVTESVTSQKQILFTPQIYCVAPEYIQRDDSNTHIQVDKRPTSKPQYNEAACSKIRIAVQSISKTRQSEERKGGKKVKKRQIREDWSDSDFIHLRVLSLLQFPRQEMSARLKRVSGHIFSKLQKHKINLKLVYEQIQEAIKSTKLEDMPSNKDTAFNTAKSQRMSKNPKVSVKKPNSQPKTSCSKVSLKTQESFSPSIFVIDNLDSKKFYFLMKYFKNIKMLWDSVSEGLIQNVPLYSKVKNGMEDLCSYIPLFIRETKNLDMVSLISYISQGLTRDQALQTLDCIDRECLAHSREDFTKQRKNSKSQGDYDLNLECDRQYEVREEHEIKLSESFSDIDVCAYQALPIQNNHIQEIDYNNQTPKGKNSNKKSCSKQNVKSVVKPQQKKSAKKEVSFIERFSKDSGKRKQRQNNNIDELDHLKDNLKKLRSSLVDQIDEKNNLKFVKDLDKLLQKRIKVEETPIDTPTFHFKVQKSKRLVKAQEKKVKLEQKNKSKSCTKPYSLRQRKENAIKIERIKKQWKVKEVNSKKKKQQLFQVLRNKKLSYFSENNMGFSTDYNTDAGMFNSQSFSKDYSKSCDPKFIHHNNQKQLQADQLFEDIFYDDLVPPLHDIKMEDEGSADIQKNDIYKLSPMSMDMIRYEHDLLDSYIDLFLPTTVKFYSHQPTTNHTPLSLAEQKQIKHNENQISAQNLQNSKGDKKKQQLKNDMSFYHNDLDFQFDQSHQLNKNNTKDNHNNTGISQVQRDDIIPVNSKAKMSCSKQLFNKSGLNPIMLEENKTSQKLLSSFDQFEKRRVPFLQAQILNFDALSYMKQEDCNNNNGNETYTNKFGNSMMVDFDNGFIRENSTCFTNNGKNQFKNFNCNQESMEFFK
eukprot:403352761